VIRTLLAVTLALLVAGSASADVTFRDIKAQYGPHGPARDSLEIFPGDEIVFHYVIDGVQTNENGKVDGTLQLKVVNESGKVILDKPTKINEILAFGGTTFPGTANLNLGLNAVPGKYQFVLTFTDDIQHQSATFERTILCRKMELAIVKPRFSYDQQGESSSSLNVSLGQKIYYHLVAVGFDRSQKKIDMELSMQLLDEKGTELLPKALVVPAKSDDPNAVEKNEAVTFKGSFNCNRVGTFKLRFTLRDNLTTKTATFEAQAKVTQ
jgi:hypothetical protein